MLYKRFFNFPNKGADWTFNEFDHLQKQINSLYGALSGRTFQTSSAGVFPLINVTEDSEKYYIRAELPGMKADELDIQATGEGISISGERKISAEGNNVKYHRREREAGKFSRVINLPGEINLDKVEASMENGILKITLPKAEHTKPRQITVK